MTYCTYVGRLLRKSLRTIRTHCQFDLCGGTGLYGPNGNGKNCNVEYSTTHQTCNIPELTVVANVVDEAGKLTSL